MLIANDRERAVLTRLLENKRGRFRRSPRDIYRAIFHLPISPEAAPVAFFGPEATFTHHA